MQRFKAFAAASRLVIPSEILWSLQLAGILVDGQTPEVWLAP